MLSRALLWRSLAARASPLHAASLRPLCTASPRASLVRHPAAAAHASDAGGSGAEDGAKLFAVVRLAGSQFKVAAGDQVVVNKLDAEVGSVISLTDVMLLGSVESTYVGRPLVPDASVKALVEEQTKDAKTLTLKKRRRKNSRNLRGSRRHVTLLRILDIYGPGAAEPQESGEGVRGQPVATSAEL